ncbi:MAG: two-component regulator propeller domain-containing protein [Bacteroides sp.]
MKRFALLLYILTLCCSAARAIYFKHIGIKEGLSQLSVLSIYQDELGRMWFGTEEGLNLYDGVRVTAFKPTLSDVGNRVNLVRNRVDCLGNRPEYPE